MGDRDGMNMTPEQLRADAARSAQYAADSWERSDTDGFLTQWASGLTAQLQRCRAELQENGRVSTFVGLYDGDRRVAATMFDQPKFNAPWLTQRTWRLRADEAERYGRGFIPAGAKSRVQKQLGLRERRERAPAWARMEGSGHGLSGQAWVATFRTGDPWGLDATLEPEGG